MQVINNISAKPTIQLNSGAHFSFLEPGPISIHDIAHGLSNICRFTGQCRTFYSVAQHSVLVSHLVPKYFALWGLLHDAVEAVCGDVSSPLKHLIPEYKVIENRCEAVILKHFGVHMPMPPEVKHADRVALCTEQRYLMKVDDALWVNLDGIQPADEVIEPMDPYEAKWVFIDRFEQLKHEAAAMLRPIGCL